MLNKDPANCYFNKDNTLVWTPLKAQNQNGPYLPSVLNFNAIYSTRQTVKFKVEGVLTSVVGREFGDLVKQLQWDFSVSFGRSKEKRRKCVYLWCSYLNLTHPLPLYIKSFNLLISCSPSLSL